MEVGEFQPMVPDLFHVDLYHFSETDLFTILVCGCHVWALPDRTILDLSAISRTETCFLCDPCVGIVISLLRIKHNAVASSCPFIWMAW